MFKKIVIIMLSFLCLSLSGCGGSTKGTGSVTVEGRVTDFIGGDLGSVLITDLNTGEQARTDANGGFALQSSANGEREVELLIESETQEIVVVIPDIQDESRRVSGTIKIDFESSISDLSDVQIEENQSSNSSDERANSDSLRKSDKAEKTNTVDENLDKKSEELAFYDQLSSGLEYNDVTDGVEKIDSTYETEDDEHQEVGSLFTLGATLLGSTGNSDE